VILPNKKEFIISLFSNGFQRPIDQGILIYVNKKGALSIFMEKLIDRINYLSNGLNKIFLTCENNQNYTLNGNWRRETSSLDKLGSHFYISNDIGNFSWNIEIPSDGYYEIMVYMPSSQNINTRVLHTLKHSIRTEEVNFNIKFKRFF
jgi:hypothetical protein